jgi:hypothetical protein
MKTWTAHMKPGRDPVLVKEGFAWGAFLFGPLWFAASRAWVLALLYAALVVLFFVFMPNRGGVVILTGVAVLAGLLGRDLVRWSLEHRGYTLAHVLAARDEDGALARLLTYRPEVASELAARLA